MTVSAQTDIMPIEHIDDWDQRLARQDAFWDCTIIDRPVVIMLDHHENSDYPPPPERDYTTVREAWLDPERCAQRALHRTMNTRYYGDALPATWPNLGPEVFSAYFGTEMEYGEGTSWSIPNLKDWNEVDKLQFDKQNFYWQKTVEMTDALLEIGKGKFYTGFTDLHPGGDAIAAFRDPLHLNIDMIDHADKVKALRERIDDVFCEVFDFFGDKLEQAGQAFTTWPGIVSSRRWHVPSNDFSCMISSQMFDDIFLPGIARECRHAEASIYHLDGPGALKHLDSLLDIKELNAIQWVFGAGNGGPTDWFDVYKKCQAAGKGLQITGLSIPELDAVIEELNPEGLWLQVNIGSAEDAELVLKKVSAWSR